MYHLCDYTASLGSVTNNDTAALADSILTIINGHFLLPFDLGLYAAAAFQANLSRVRLTSPKLRQTNPLYLEPINLSAPGVNNPNVLSFFDAPVILKGQEEVEMDVTTSAAGPAQYHGLLWLADTIVPPPAGDVFFLRATSTTTATANAWTLLSYTLETQLPAGRYAMIYSETQSASGVAHRWIFDNQFLRPGNLSFIALGSRNYHRFYEYAMGVMGYFYTYSLPRCEVLCTAADAAFEMRMAVVKVPGGPAPQGAGVQRY